MLHMNKTPRYQQLYRDLRNVYLTRGDRVSDYMAGLAIGGEIQRHISDVEFKNLVHIFTVARNAKR